jgi:hypothetical protein
MQEEYIVVKVLSLQGKKSLKVTKIYSKIPVSGHCDLKLKTAGENLYVTDFRI